MKLVLAALAVVVVIFLVLALLNHSNEPVVQASIDRVANEPYAVLVARLGREPLRVSLRSFGHEGWMQSRVERFPATQPKGWLNQIDSTSDRAVWVSGDGEIVPVIPVIRVPLGLFRWTPSFRFLKDDKNAVFFPPPNGIKEEAWKGGSPR